MRFVTWVLATAAIVALVLLSLGSLISIFLAAVLALGLDPVVGALQRRGWKRGTAALTVFAALIAAVVALVLAAATPVWAEIVEFVHSLPALWDEVQQTSWFNSIVSTGN